MLYDISVILILQRGIIVNHVDCGSIGYPAKCPT
jgi:hypothetical protein